VFTRTPSHTRTAAGDQKPIWREPERVRSGSEGKIGTPGTLHEHQFA
jgi:hypothetical protein